MARLDDSRLGGWAEARDVDQAKMAGAGNQDPVAPHGQLAPRRRPNVAVVQADQPAAGRQRYGAPAKPTPDDLGVDLAALDWQRSGNQAGAFEVAFVAASRGGQPGHDGSAGGQGVDWVLLRVADDPAGRVLVYDRTEWMCFIDGADRGEFDLACELAQILGHPAGAQEGPDRRR